LTPKAALQAAKDKKTRVTDVVTRVFLLPTRSASATASSGSEAHVHAFCSDVDQANHRKRPAMFDVIPYWMWVVSLIVLAVMCGAALSFHLRSFAQRGADFTDSANSIEHDPRRPRARVAARA
jgi:hypothetical protein